MNDEACYTIIRDTGIRSGEFERSSASVFGSEEVNTLDPELLLTLLASRAHSKTPSSLILKNSDTSATGSTDEFLASRLRFTVDANGQEICLLKAGDEEVGVMMGWEQGISEFLLYILIRIEPNK